MTRYFKSTEGFYNHISQSYDMNAVCIWNSITDCYYIEYSHPVGGRTTHVGQPDNLLSSSTFFEIKGPRQKFQFIGAL